MRPAVIPFDSPIDISAGGTPPRTIHNVEEIATAKRPFALSAATAVPTPTATTAPAPAPAPAPPPACAPRARRRWPRRLAWLFLCLLVLLAIFVTTVQLVLWSGYPRTFVIGQLESQFGLRVDAASLQTDWWGDTTLTDVALSLPLGKDAFLRVPRMEVHHTALIPLLLRRPLQLHDITLDRPTLIVAQDRAGRWNISEVAELLGRVGGSQQAGAATTSPAPAAAPAPSSAAHSTLLLPEIAIENATLRLIPWDHDPIDIGAIDLRGHPDGRLVWLYTLQAGEDAPGHPSLAIKGQLAPGGAWRHALRVSAHDLKPWLAPFLPDFPSDATADLSWQGELHGDSLAGLLEIHAAHAAGFDAAGLLDVSAPTGATALPQALLHPRSLTLHTPYAALSTLSVQEGSIALSPTAVAIDDLHLHALNGPMIVSATYNRLTRDGSAHVAFQDIQPAPVARLTGQASLTLAPAADVFSADQTVTLTLNARAATPSGLLDTVADLHATGHSFDHLSWNAEIHRLAWSGWPAVDLQGLAANGSLTPEHLTLASVTGQGPGRFAGSGNYDLRSKTWTALLQAHEVPLPRASQTLDITLDAKGDAGQIALQQATLHAGGIAAQASGTYIFALPQPLTLAVALQDMPLGPAAAATQPDGDTPLPLRGRIRANAALQGTVHPLALAIQGHLVARDLALENHPLGDADVDLSGALTDQRLHLATTDMSLFTGHWNWSADLPLDTRLTTLHVAASDLPLADVSAAFHWTTGEMPLLAGLASGSLTLQAPGFDLAKAQGQGSIHISDAAIHPPASVLPPILAASADAAITLDRGRLQISPSVQEASAASGASGALTGTIGTRLRDPGRIELDLHLADWSVAFPPKQSRIRLSTDLAGNFDAATLSGNLRAATHTELWYHDESVGHVAATASLAGRVVTLATLHADLLTGALDGHGRVDLDAPLASTLQLAWHDVDIARLIPFSPWLDDAAGISSGDLSIDPATEPHPLAPLKLAASFTTRNGSFRGIAIGDGSATAYAGPTRFVLDRSTLQLAGGRVNLWARTLRRDDRWSTSQFRIGIDKLDLNPFVQAFHPASKEMVGQVSGSINILGDPRRANSLSGEGALTIDKSDLANSHIIGGVYALMHIGSASGPATGRGRVAFRFEQGDAHITDLAYFNRGIQLRAAGHVNNILGMPNSPIDLIFAGSARPLRDIRLPVLADLDEIVGVLQSHVTTLRATGTFADPHVAPLLLQQASTDLKELLLGDTKKP